MEEKSDNQPGVDETASVFRDAIQRGDIELVRNIAENGGPSFDINKPGRVCGRLPIYWAVKRGLLDMARVLLSLGADVNGMSHVHTDQGNWAFYDKEPPLLTAVRHRHIAMVKLLLREGADPNMQTLFSGKTALHVAAAQENVSLVRILLEQGASPDIPRHNGGTPLHSAATSWCYCKSQCSGARASSRRKRRQHERQCLVLQMLSDAARDEAYEDFLPPLYAAVVIARCTEKAAILLKAGGDINFRPSSPMHWRNETALHFAAHRNNTGMVQFLINNEAILDVTDGNGETPLSKNIREVPRSVIPPRLIVHGASVAVKDRYNRSLIDLCLARTDRVDLCRLLVFAGCKVTKTSQPGHDKQQSRSDVELCAWLETTRRNPHRLDDLSRIYIRKFLSKNVVKGKSLVRTVMKMDILPKVMVDYLLLKDLTNIALEN